MTAVKRGDVFYADLNKGTTGGSVQSGLRPVLIVQNDVGNAHSPTTIVVPLTSKKKKKYLPTHVCVQADQENGLRCDSVALLEQFQTIDKSNLMDRLGCIKDMRQIDRGMSISLGLSMA